MHKADINPENAKTGTSPYPEAFREKHLGRKAWVLTKQYGLSQFGVNRVELPPGCWSTQRHWHRLNDEAVIVVEGELVLVTDDGEEQLSAGDCVCFKAGVPNPHHLQNRSDKTAIFYDIGGRDQADVTTFPEMGVEAFIAMKLEFRPIKK